MKKELVPYPESLELKKLGFNEPCFGFFRPNGDLMPFCVSVKGNIMGCKYEHLSRLLDGEEIKVLSPTYSQALKWFRKKHLLEGLVLPQDKSALDPLPLYFIAIESYKDGIWTELFNSTNEATLLHYSEHEEAELACLRKLIELVKNE